jgi:hypothetical protein
MPHTSRRYTTLLIASILCGSALPAQSAEQSWSSFALEGLGAWTTCAGTNLWRNALESASILGISTAITVGSIVAHEYGHALAAKAFNSENPITITIGAGVDPRLKELVFWERWKNERFNELKKGFERLKETLLKPKPPSTDVIDRKMEDLRENLKNGPGRGLLRPYWFPDGFNIPTLALGNTCGMVTDTLIGWRAALKNCAGPLAGAGFCGASLQLAKLFPWGDVQIVAKFLIAFHAIENLRNLLSLNEISDGAQIQKWLRVPPLFYNALATPLLCAAAYKIVRL